MLTRTRADQVVPVYEKFFARFPSFETLKSANLQEAYEIFASLGLNRRARNVVDLVKTLAALEGEIPTNVKDLASLPAVGDYVARAVMCYAFGLPEAPIDTNVIRIISRIFGFRTNDSSRRDEKFLEFAKSLVPKDRPREFNLALLDFGALVCKPKPLCTSCPLNSTCSYYQKVKA
jgi:A/G-specific adenine glycosylase